MLNTETSSIVNWVGKDSNALDKGVPKSTHFQSLYSFVML